MIVRHIVEISEDDVMTYRFYYLSRATTLNSANTKLVTLAPGLRTELRFAPLARGLLCGRFLVVKIYLFLGVKVTQTSHYSHEIEF